MLKVSPVDAVHRTLGAKVGSFGGWDMPISYPAGTLAEHAAVRDRVGLFDVSHLGKIRLTGDALGLLERSLSNKMADLAPGRARYALILQEDGGIIDDLIAYAIHPEDVLVVPNASNRDAVAAVLGELGDDSVSQSVVDLTTFAVQGPKSKAIIEGMFPAAKGMPYMGVVGSDRVMIARSGYSGEWGYEVFTSFGDALDVWHQLELAVTAHDGQVCGLAARDTLRLEMGYPLHGNDISREVNPFEAGLSWAVKLEGRDFPGAAALRAMKATRAVIGLRADHRVIPRAGCAVMSGGETVGVVTSGTLSPTLRQPIALALVDIDASMSTSLDVDVRGRVGTFEVCKPPFVGSSPRKEP